MNVVAEVAHLNVDTSKGVISPDPTTTSAVRSRAEVGMSKVWLKSGSADVYVTLHATIASIF